jgi:tetratricopeptide (TPR) repeat protein
MGDHEPAVVELTAAVAEMASIEDRNQHARALMFLGAAHLRADQPGLAADAMREALSVVRELGSPYYQAEVLSRLGELAQQQGDREGAVERYTEAARLYAIVQDPQAEVMRSRVEALTVG